MEAPLNVEVPLDPCMLTVVPVIPTVPLDA